MFPLDLNKLTPEQRAMVALWEEHLKAEFQDKDARASCDTMVANPYVNHVPVMTGGVGRRQRSISTAATSSPACLPTWNWCPSRARSAMTASWTNSSSAAR